MCHAVKLSTPMFHYHKGSQALYTMKIKTDCVVLLLHKNIFKIKTLVTHKAKHTAIFEQKLTYM